MQDKILVVDDEKEIADLVALYLENENFTVFRCYTAGEALKYIREEKLDLAILDVMLPDMDGFLICQEIRKEHNYPVIMLTAKGEETDKITGLTLGADDYITKPFLPLELVARVKAQLRRYKRYNSGGCQEEETILVQILCQQKGNVVSSEELFRQIWKEEYFSKNSNTITVHIRHLREKMGDSFEEPKYIKTVWGVGYKIEK